MVSNLIHLTFAINFNELKNWYNSVKNPGINCLLNDDKLVNNTIPMVQVTDCDHSNAIVNYEFKVILQYLIHDTGSPLLGRISL